MTHESLKIRRQRTKYRSWVHIPYPSAIALSGSPIILLLSVSLFGLHENAKLQWIGRNLFYSLCVLVPLLYTTLIIKSSYLPNYVWQPAFVIFSILIIYIIHFALLPNITSFTFMIQVAIVLSFFCLFGTIAGAADRTGSDTSTLALSLLLILFAIAATTKIGTIWSGGFLNPNTLAMFAFTTLSACAILLNINKTKKIALAALLVASLIIVAATGSRAVTASILMSAITYLFWPIISSRRFYSDFYFGLILLTLFFIVYVTISPIKDTALFTDINEKSIDIFGKKIASGRNVLWGDISVLIAERYLFGWGTNILPGEMIGTRLSLHNWYLVIFFQTGIFGLSLFICMFYMMWRYLNRSRKEHISRVFAGFFVGFLYLHSFEVVLTQNNLNFGLIFWCLAGLVLGRLSRLEKAKIVVGRSRIKSRC